MAGEPGTRSSVALLVAVSLGYGAVFLGVAIFSPLLPTMSDRLGITPFGAGVALTLLWAVRALVQYPSGRLSDYSSRKTLLVAGLGTAFTGSLVLASAPSYAVLLAGTAILSLGSGLYAPVGIALVSERFADRRGGAIGVLIGTADLAGAAAGLIAVAAVSLAAWRAGFLPVAAAVAVAALLVHAWNDEPYAPPRRVRLGLVETGGRLLGDVHFRGVLVALGLWMFVFRGAVSFLPTFLFAEKAVSVELAGGGFALLWGVGVVVKPIAGRLGDRLGHLPVAVATLALGAAGLGGLLAAEGTAPLAASVVAFAAGLLATTPVVYAHVTGFFPDGSVGSDVGALRAFLALVGSTGPLFVGAVAARADYSAAFAGLALAMAASAAAVAVLVVRRRG